MTLRERIAWWRFRRARTCKMCGGLAQPGEQFCSDEHAVEWQQTASW